MRVAHVANSTSRLAGGMFESVKGLCRALIGLQAVNIVVYSAFDAYSDIDKDSWGTVDLRICENSGTYSFLSGNVIGKSLLDDNIDVLNRPYVVSVRGMLDRWALRRSRVKKLASYLIWERSVLKNATYLHALSEAEARSIRQYGLTNPICIVPNGVEIPDLPSNNDKHAGRRILLFIGRLHTKKGLEELFHAWARVGGSVREKWALNVAGWDEIGLKSRLITLSKRLKIDKDVTFLGPVYGREKDSLFRSASAFILPSHSEGLPMAVLEAWSYGLPVFMTKHCNLVNGFLENAAFEIDLEPSHMARVLERVLNQEAACQAAGRNGRIIVQRDHGWKAISEEMTNIYEKCAGLTKYDRRLGRS
jgi:glycosyltransferase involved in cell wall biosynthesis